jgi:RNA-directed DNA polymerase
VREITGSQQSGKDVKQIIAELNPALRGWGNYFRKATADREFLNMDSFVYRRLVSWMYRRAGQRRPKRAPWTGQQLHGMGLYRLRGTVRYAAQATPRRSSVSRVRENRTHGLKGDLMETGQLG